MNGEGRTGETVCPVCGRPSGEGRVAPFCSVRCADVDLGRWFTESYRVPASPLEDGSSSEPERD